MPLQKKICLLGDFAVGKTSLVSRFVYNRFDDKYITTIGVKVSRKTLVVPTENALVELVLMVWDIAGEQEFIQVRNSYLRGAAGAILVGDLTRPETFEHMQAYIETLYSFNHDAQMIIAANKCDLVEQIRVTHKDIEAIGKGYLPCYMTSAKTGDKVESVFRHLGDLLVK